MVQRTHFLIPLSFSFWNSLHVLVFNLLWDSKRDDGLAFSLSLSLPLSLPLQPHVLSLNMFFFPFPLPPFPIAVARKTARRSVRIFERGPQSGSNHSQEDKSVPRKYLWSSYQSSGNLRFKRSNFGIWIFRRSWKRTGILNIDSVLLVCISVNPNSPL